MNRVSVDDGSVTEGTAKHVFLAFWLRLFLWDLCVDTFFPDLDRDILNPDMRALLLTHLCLCRSICSFHFDAPRLDPLLEVH